MSFDLNKIKADTETEKWGGCLRRSYRRILPCPRHWRWSRSCSVHAPGPGPGRCRSPPSPCWRRTGREEHCWGRSPGSSWWSRMNLRRRLTPSPAGGRTQRQSRMIISSLSNEQNIEAYANRCMNANVHVYIYFIWWFEIVWDNWLYTFSIIWKTTHPFSYAFGLITRYQHNSGSLWRFRQLGLRVTAL